MKHSKRPENSHKSCSSDLRHGNNMYRACLAKRRYRTKEYADKMAEFYTEKYGKQQYVYYCPYCFGYHLTSTPR